MGRLTLLIVLSCFLLFPINTSAMVNLDKIEEGKSMFDSNVNFSDSLNATTQTVNENTMIWSSIIPAIFTVIFIYFLIRFAYALFTKVGSTLKTATWGLISIPIIFIFFRVVGIFVLGENDIQNVDGYLNSIISLLSSSVFFIAIGLVFIGLLFRMSYILIKHPAYNRWSNRLFLFSVISIILSVVVEPVLYNI